MTNPYLDALDSQLAQQAQPKAPSANPYVDALDRMAPTKAITDSAARATPATAMDEVLTSRKVGLPLDVVQRNLPEVKAKLRAQELEEMLSRDAALRHMTYTQEGFAESTSDEWPKLSEIGQAVGSFTRYVMGADANGGLPGLVGRGAKKAYHYSSGGSAGVFRAGFETLDKVVPNFEDGPNILGAAAQLFGGIAKDQFGKAEAMSVNQHWVANATESGVASLGQNAKYMPLLAFGPAGATAALLGMVLESGGSSFQKGREKGNALVPSLTYAASDAVIEYATEKLPMSKLLGDIAANTSFVKTLAKQMAYEIPGEQIATVLQDMNEWAVINPEKSFRSYLEERPGAAAETLIATMVGTGGNVAVAKGIDTLLDGKVQREMQEAQERGELMKELFTKAAGSQVRELDPDTFRKYVQAAADNTEGAPKSAFIDGGVLMQTLQKAGVTDEQLAQMLPGVSSQLADAGAMNSPVEIPLGDLAAALPGTPLQDALLPHLRMSGPESLSQMEAEDASTNAQELLQQKFTEVIQQAKDSERITQGANVVYDSMKTQMMATGRMSEDVAAKGAALVREYYTVMSSYMGTTPDALFAANQYKVAAQGQNTGVLNDTGRPGALNLEGYHYSTQARPVISGHAFGSGLKGSGQEMYASAADKRLRNRSYFYVDTGNGITPEAGVGGIGHKVNLSNIYDANSDPLRLRKGGQLAFESAVLDRGFDGYLDRLSGTQPGQVVVLSGKPINAEVLGPLGKTNGKVAPPTVERESRGRDQVVDRINANKTLPAGSPTLARWAEILQAQMPAEYEAMRDAGVFEGDQTQNVYKSELVKAFEGKTENPEYAAGRNPAALNQEEKAQYNALSDDMFPGEFADAKTTVDTGRVVNSKGDTEQGGNVNSNGQQIAATKQALQNFWSWFGNSQAVDNSGQPLVMYHSTNADTSVLKAGQKTTNNYGLLGDVELSRSGIFMTPEKDFSQEYLRSGDGKNVMPLYVKLENPFDTRNGISQEQEKELVDAGISSRWLYDYRQHDWEMYDNADDGTNAFTDALKKLGYDGAIFNEEGQDGNTHVTYMAFESAQLKSATGNLGTYSRNADNILRQGARATLDDFSPENIGGILGKDSWSILTAENPMGEQASAEDNAAKMAELKADLDALGVQYTEAVGKYGQVENSLVVTGISEADAVALGAKYAQDSVLTPRGLVYPRDGSVTPVTGKVDVFSDAPEDFYTTIPSTGAKFAIELDWREGATDYSVKQTDKGFEALDSDGKVIGKLESNITPEQSKQINESASVDIVKVNDDRKGQGVGRALYAAWNDAHEGRITPSGKTSTDAWKLWKRNYPEKVAEFVQQEALRIAQGSPESQVLGNITDPEIKQAVVDAVPNKYQAKYAAKNDLLNQDVKAQYDALADKPLAPNGKPSNLTKTQHRIVRTPEFKAWFGDWEKFANAQGGVWSDDKGEVSKAVDENGEPLVVYHGTNLGGFNTFRETGGERRGDLGIFLTPNKEMARSYVRRGKAQVLSREQIDGDVGKPGIYALFANIRRPREESFNGANWSGERIGQFEAYDANGDVLYNEDGNDAMTLEEARKLAEDNDGSYEEASPLPYTTDSVTREARKDKNDGAIVRDVQDDGGGVSGYAGEPSDLYVAFDPAQVKSVENFGAFDPGNPNILAQPTTGGARGTFNPATLTTVLNENADLSTFLHETGHFFLEMTMQLASTEGAPAEVMGMAEQLLKSFGVKDLATWNGMTLDQKRKHHERFAETFEMYLLEGKAPSTELQSLFRVFRAWLTRVYKSLQQFAGDKGITLDKDLTDVMDRMLATEAQIAEAEKVAGLIPELDATGEAIEQLNARSVRDLKWAVNARNKFIAAAQREARETRKAVQAEVTAEVNAMREFQAKEQLDKMRKENGEQLNDTELTIIADAFEFASVSDMLKAIDAAGKKADVIEGMTDQRMLERHGDLTDQAAIEQAATEAVHNKARAKSLATELSAQQDMVNARGDTGKTDAAGRKVTVNVLMEAAKQFAANVIGKRNIGDLKKAAWAHTQAERRAGVAWQAATKKGDTQAAVKAKQDQVLNNAAVRAAQEAITDVQKTIAFFNKVTRGNSETVVEKGRDPDIVNAARAILAVYGVAPFAGKNAFEYMDLLKANDPGLYAVLENSVRGAMANAKPLDKLTVSELGALRDEIASMWHLAKSSRQYEVAGNKMDIAEAGERLVDRLVDKGIPDRVPGEGQAVTEREKFGRSLQFAGALLRRVESWAESIDGKFGGPFLRLVYQPVKEAADRYRSDRIKYRKAFTALVENVAPELRPGVIDAPELGYTFGKGKSGSGQMELTHALLHLGNESNKRKLLLGRGWATEVEGVLDTSKWDAFMKRMHETGTVNKAHYDFAQGVWDLLDSMKPLAQKTHRDVFGRYFAEVTANPFEVEGIGYYRGGYVPAQVDPEVVKDNEIRKLAELENENMAYAFPTTNKGFTKSRTEYNRPLLLDLHSLPQHIDKVLLFSHMEPVVRGVSKVLQEKGVAYNLNRVDPSAISGMLSPWLTRSARQIVETPVVGDGRVSRVLSVVRQRAGMSVMFGNLSNTLQQITGASIAAVKVKPKHLMQAMAQYTSSPKKTTEAVAKASEFMAHRMENEVAALNSTMDEILLNPSVYKRAENWTTKHTYFLQSAFDNVISPVVWTGAYNQALEEGMTEPDAVRFADGTIRQTQGSTLPEDVSRIETGPAYARVFTQFIGYFNMVANTNVTALRNIANDMGMRKGAGKALPIVFFGLLAPAWIAEAIAQAFRGGPGDDDGDGSFLDDWLTSVFGMGTLKTVLAGIPFVGQFALAGINSFNSKPYDDKTNLSPAVSMLEGAVGAPHSVYKALAEDGSKQKAVRDLATAVSLATGLPAGFVARPLGYLAGVAAGEVDPTSAVDAVRGVATGSTSPESKR